MDENTSTSTDTNGFEFTTTQPNIVNISYDNGKVTFTALKEGGANIYVKKYGYIFSVIYLNVLPKVVPFTVDTTDITYTPGTASVVNILSGNGGYSVLQGNSNFAVSFTNNTISFKASNYLDDFTSIIIQDKRGKNITFTLKPQLQNSMEYTYNEGKTFSFAKSGFTPEIVSGGDIIGVGNNADGSLWLKTKMP